MTGTKKKKKTKQTSCTLVCMPLFCIKICNRASMVDRLHGSLTAGGKSYMAG